MRSVLWGAFLLFFVSTAVSAQTIQEKVQGWLSRGQLQLERGQINKAIDSFNEALALDPDNAQALVLLISARAALQPQTKAGVAELLQQSQRKMDGGDISGAIEALNRALQLDPNNARALSMLFTLEAVAQKKSSEHVVALLSSAREQLQKGDYDGARLGLFEVLKLDPENSEAFYRFGELYQRTGDNDKAAQFFARSVAVAPENFSLRYSVGRNFERLGLDRQAKDMYESIIRIAGTTRFAEEARRRLAVLEARKLASEQFPQDAARVLERARKAYPEASELYLPLVRIYLSVGRSDDALRILQELKRLAPDQPIVYQALAMVYGRSGNKAKQREQLVKILTLTPKGSAAHRNALLSLERLTLERVKPLIEKKNIGAALNGYVALLVIDPDNIFAWRGIAALLARLDKPIAAESAWWVAFKLTPDDPVAEYGLARMLVKNRNYIDAFPLLERVAEQQAEPTLAQNALDNFLNILTNIGRRMGNETYEQQIQFIERLIAQRPQDDSIRSQLGLLYVKDKKHERGAQLFQEALKINPDNYQARLYLGDIYAATKKLEQAETAYRQIIDAGADVPQDIMTTARMRLVGHYLHNDRVADAMPLIEEIAEKEPASRPKTGFGILATPYDRQAAILAQQKKLAQAVTLVEKALAENPSDVELKLKLGIYAARNGEHDRAIKLFDQILQVQPDNAALLIRKGVELESLKREDEARQVYQQVLTTDGVSDDIVRLAQFQIGRLNLAGRKLDTALELYLQLTKDSPEDIKAWLGLASVRQARGEFPLAEMAMARAIALEPDARKAQMLAGQLRLLQVREKLSGGNLEGARDMLQEITGDEPGNVAAYLMLAGILTQLDKREEAIEAYKKAVEIQPQNFSAQMRLGFLYEGIKREEDAVIVYRTLTHMKGISAAQRKSAEQRLRAVRRRIAGLRSSMSYSISLNDSLNQSSDNASFSYSSRIGFNFQYNRKFRRKATFGARFSPTYSVFHVSQFDSLAGAGTGTVRFSGEHWDFTGGYNYQENRGLLSGRRSSRSRSPFVNGKWVLQFKPLFRPWARRPVQSTVSLNVAAGSSNSASSPFLGNRSRSASLSFSQPYRGGGWRLGYSWSRIENKHPLGTDNARQSNSLNLGVSRSLFPKLSVSLGLNGELAHFLNEDSAFPGRFRRYERYSGTLSLNYRLSRDFNLALSYSQLVNNASLPVGIGQLFTGEQLVTSFQSTGLGDFSSRSLRGTLNFSF